MNKLKFWEELNDALDLIMNSDTLISLQKINTEISSYRKRALDKSEVIVIILDYFEVESKHVREVIYRWLFDNIDKLGLHSITKEELLSILHEKVDKSFLKYLNNTSTKVIHQVLQQVFAKLYENSSSDTKSK